MSNSGIGNKLNLNNFFVAPQVRDNYEDIFDYYSKLDEGAVAPVSVPLSAAAQRSTEVYNKLYDLGYNPSMNIYSRGQLTSLCPTFKLGEEIYFIECNNNKYTVNVLADEHGAVKTQLIGFDKYEELKH